MHVLFAWCVLFGHLGVQGRVLQRVTSATNRAGARMTGSGRPREIAQHAVDGTLDQ